MTNDEVIIALNEEYGIGFDSDYYSTEKYEGRYFRIIGQFLQISDNDFDRWANSVESELDFTRMKRKRFLRDFACMIEE